MKNMKNMNIKRKDKSNSYNSVNGRALFNGILLTGDYKECIVYRNNDNELDAIININCNKNKKNIIYKLPFFRGIISIFYNVKNSVPYIIKSINNSENKILKREINKVDEVTNTEILIGYILAFILMIIFFVIVPNIISSYYVLELQNIIQFVIQVILSLIYLLLINLNNNFLNLFKYHGAEHKVINAYTELKEKFDNNNDIINNVTIERVKLSSRFHYRCGGNLLVYYMFFNFLITLFFPTTNFILKSIIQIFGLIFNVSIAFEMLILTAKLSEKFKFIGYPAMLIQYITTKEPNNSQLEVAVYCMRAYLTDKLDTTVKDYINNYTNYLKINNITYALNDIMRLISAMLNIDTNEIFLNPESILLEYNQQIKLDRNLKKMYFDNIPLQYIIGKQNFYNEEYIVNPNVLIPRVDTEILVEQAIKYIKLENITEIVDMCTGSGCVGISIANNCNIINKVILVDISKEALEVARENMHLNKVAEKCLLINSDLFNDFLQNNNLKEKKYKMIVSNPPYIMKSEIEKLDKKVQNEPIIALDGGKDGLVLYNRIFKEAKKYLHDRGLLILEIGYNQKDQIIKIIKENQEYEYVDCIKDLGMNDRVIICRFHQK